MSDKKVSIIYTLKDKASKGIKGLISSVKNLKKSLFSLNTFLTGLTFGVVANAALKAAKMFGIQEEAVKGLNTALKNSGIYTKKTSENLQKYASDLQKVTIYGDEQLIKAQSLFAQFGLNESAIKKLTKATTDLAAAKGIDLRQAADLLAKSVGSSTNALSRYGVIIKGLPNSTERINSAIESLSNLFGGQAKTQAETFNGSIIQMKNSVGDLIEIVGEKLIPIILKTSNLIKNFSDRLQSYDYQKINKFLIDVNSGFILIYKSIKVLYKEISKSLIGIFKLKKTFNNIFSLLNNNFLNIFNKNKTKKIEKQQKKLFDSILKIKKNYHKKDLENEEKYYKKLKKIKNELIDNKKNKIENKQNFVNTEKNKKQNQNESVLEKKISKKREELDLELNINIENKNKLLLEQKKFLEKQIKNEYLNIKQKEILNKNFLNFKKKNLEKDYINHKIQAEALLDLTDTLSNFEIRSSEDVAKASVQILKKSLNSQINGIIKTGITKALSQANYPLIGAIVAAGAAAKIAINAMKFSKGGIVPGNKNYGDKIIGRLNSGEMILNKAQQSRLFNLINNVVLAKKSNDYYIYENETFKNFLKKRDNNKREIIILTDDGRELAKGISYIQNEMKRNGEIM